MTRSDVPSALQLTVQAGWNQTPGDWLRMIELEPNGCLVAEVDGKLIGTTVCCTFDEIAWLALVLVDTSFRERGIGRRLVQAGLKYADDSGVRTVRLDATPLGRPVYERLGFQPQFELSRWGGIPTGAVVASSMPQIDMGTSVSDYELLFELEKQAIGTNRKKLLQRLFAESPPTTVWNGGQVTSFLTRRPGRLSTQIGPGIGSREECSQLLEGELVAALGRPVIVDIPIDRGDLNAVAERAGLTVQRTLLRMYRGESVVENASLFQISSGAELG
ncbi:MAG: putative acyltransferase [Planctomycetaceae bacterium]|nr:putative acyltransferase [Planctomycetaceae bacterium]